MEKEEERTSQDSLKAISEIESKVKEIITSAERSAEEIIATARNEVDAIKEEIVAKARQDRNRSITKSIAAANLKADAIVEKAQKDSIAFYAAGNRHIDEGVSLIIDMVLDSGKEDLK